MNNTWSPLFLNFMSNASLLEESMGTGCNPSYAIPLYSQRGESNGTCWNFVAGSHQFSRVYMLPWKHHFLQFTWVYIAGRWLERQHEDMCKIWAQCTTFWPLRYLGNMWGKATNCMQQWVPVDSQSRIGWNCVTIGFPWIPFDSHRLRMHRNQAFSCRDIMHTQDEINHRTPRFATQGGSSVIVQGDHPRWIYCPTNRQKCNLSMEPCLLLY